MYKLLLVEDDETLVFGIEYALQKEGFDLQVATTVHQAQELFVGLDNYDLVILDVNLPDGNGFELCKEIRETSDIPIIFLTACDEEVNVVLGLELGGDGYITKPFRVGEFISRIKALLRRSNKGSVERSGWQSQDIVFDTKLMKAYKHGEELLLTPVEYKLLSIFLNHPLQVLKREQFLEHIWDVEGEFVDDNTLSVYIRRLREKIEDHPSKPTYIKTIRGIGYKWNQRSRSL